MEATATSPVTSPALSPFDLTQYGRFQADAWWILASEVTGKPDNATKLRNLMFARSMLVKMETMLIQEHSRVLQAGE
jgi:hypothetical protein